MRFPRNTTALDVSRSLLTAVVSLAGAWAIVLIVRALVESRASGPVDWSVISSRLRAAPAEREQLSVSGYIWEQLDLTIELLVGTILVTLAASLLYLVIHRGLVRRGLTGLAQALRLAWLNLWMAVPLTLLSLLMLLVFAVWLDLFPVGNFASDISEGFADHLQSLVIPLLMLSLIPTMLLTQKVLGELSSRSISGARGYRVIFNRRVGLFMASETLRMAGLILALTIFVGGGIARFMVFGNVTLALAVAWTLAIIVIASRLAADLVQIAGRYILARELNYETPRASDEGAIQSDSRQKPARFALYTAAGIFAVLTLIAVLSPVTADNPYRTSLRDRLAPPSSSHLLGADYVGRDVLSRIIHGIRAELSLAAAVTAITLLVSVPGAILATALRQKEGARWRLLHDASLWPAYILTAFPWAAMPVLVLVALTAPPDTPIYGTPASSFGIALIAILLTVLPRACFMFIEGLRSQSAGSLGSQIAATAVAMLPFIFAVTIFISVNLSAVGLMYVPPQPRLGLMAADGRAYLTTAPLIALVPAIVGLLLIFSLLLAGSALLDLLRVPSKKLWARALE